MAELEPFRESLQGVAVESTFNWYWLVDGLRKHKFPAVLVRHRSTETTGPLIIHAGKGTAH